MEARRITQPEDSISPGQHGTRPARSEEAARGGSRRVSARVPDGARQRGALPWTQSGDAADGKIPSPARRDDEALPGPGKHAGTSRARAGGGPTRERPQRRSERGARAPLPAPQRRRSAPPTAEIIPSNCKSGQFALCHRNREQPLRAPFTIGSPVSATELAEGRKVARGRLKTREAAKKLGFSVTLLEQD